MVVPEGAFQWQDGRDAESVGGTGSYRFVGEYGIAPEAELGTRVPKLERRSPGPRPLVPVWADGVYSGLRGEQDKLCARVVIGVNARGEKYFLAIEEGVR